MDAIKSSCSTPDVSDRNISTINLILERRTSLPPSQHTIPFIEVPVPSQGGQRSCISDFTMNRFDFWNCSNSGILFFYILLYVYIYQLIPMVAAVSCGCIGATTYTIYAAITKTDVRFVNTIMLIRLNLP